MLSDYDCERAAELLENQFFDYVVEDVGRQIHQEWTKANSPMEREDLWRQQRLISRLVGRLRSVANDDAFRKRTLAKDRQNER